MHVTWGVIGGGDMSHTPNPRDSKTGGAGRYYDHKEPEFTLP